MPHAWLSALPVVQPVVAAFVMHPLELPSWVRTPVEVLRENAATPPVAYVAAYTLVPSDVTATPAGSRRPTPSTQVPEVPSSLVQPFRPEIWVRPNELRVTIVLAVTCFDAVNVAEAASTGATVIAVRHSTASSVTVP